MSGIKDLHTLLYWFNNTQGEAMKKVLRNSRYLPKEKVDLIRELEREGFFKRNLIDRKFENKPPSH